MIGSTVSHYRILERLGGGGMGVVYKALNLKLDRFVALKFLSAQRSATDEYKRRFAREAKAASALDHPNICTVYDIDETPDGHIFIAMALCEGETLKRKLERGPLPVDEAVEIAAQVAAGLGQAHARGIVHRDVKPGNVIVAPDGGVKLVDFGIAKLADHSRITRIGTAVGTAAYMAPEQFRDEAIDSRVDIWALGVLLYEMLTGRLPFDDEDEKELIRQILHGEPRPLRQVRDGIAESLERVVKRALSKRPADRYLQMEEMRTDLVRLAGTTDSWSTMEPTVVAVPGRPLSSTHVTEGSATSLVGRTIARYRVLEHLGGGGMGVIYKAEDSQLSRIVALKFLPPELVRDPDAKARFLQEARSASSLEHPNICTIHEIGEDEEGRLYIVMPCYDGETLRRKIERGPLTLDEATDIAQQIARGLSKAHRAGIVHRDIKPANLVVTSDGVVKILDFGLAKLAGTLGLTRTGSSLGTPAYMSPEQAKGDPVDHRADLWSLGVVLYEMLAGRRPFRGDHDQAVMYSILNEEPQPLAQARVDVPPELEKIIDGLLKKLPSERFPSIDGPLLALRAMRNETLTGTLRIIENTDAEIAAERKTWLRTAVVATVLLTLAAIGGTWWVAGRKGAESAPEPRFDRLTVLDGRESFPSLSPDGSDFVYAKSVGDNYDIFLQRVGGGNPINLTQGSLLADTHPAFSPDGKQIVFRSERDGGGLFRMGATGESVTRLTRTGYDPAWSPDGQEVAFATESVDNPGTRRTTSEIWRINLAEGEPKRIPTTDAVQPAWSPNGHRIAFWGLQNGSAQRKIWTVKPDGSDPVLAVEHDSVNWNPVWSPDGKFLYFASDRSGTMSLWRIKIDEGSGKVSGAPQAISPPSPSSAFMSFSRDGRQILYASNDSKANVEKVAFDPLTLRAEGPSSPVTEGARSVRSLAVSPDGRWIAFYSTTPQEDIYVVGADGSGLRQLTDDRRNDRQPQWTPDGRKIVFYSFRPNRYVTWAIPAEGGTLEQLTRTQEPSTTVPILSPDGKRLAVSVDEGEVLVDLTVPLEQRKLVPLRVKGQLGESFFASSWSPDGAFLAGDVSAADNSSPTGIGYYSFETGQVVRLTSSGTTPLWMPDNRTLLYTDDGKVMAVDRVTGRVQVVVEPGPNSDLTGVGVSPDGRTLYAIRADQEEDIWLLTFQ